MVLHNISLEIGEGECIAVMGENGAGKTSFCRLLNGLIPHSLGGRLTGTVTVAGIRTASSTVAQIARVAGSVFEDPQTQLFTARVSDEAAFALENMLMPLDEIRERVLWALDAVGLSAYADYAPSALSGGQKQRLAIAAALAMAEKILVLDEPASQLDPEGARDILSLINNLHEQKKLTVIMATNSCEEAAEIADRICLLKSGSLAALGTPQRIFADGCLLDDCGIEPPRPCGVNLKSKFTQIKTGSQDNTDNVIQIEHVRYRYPDGNMVLRDVNLAFRENEFTAITGRNGCGKTTLLKNICGLLRPSQGSILLRRRDTVDMNTAEIAGEIGFIMQDPDRQLFESTVINEVVFSLKQAGRNQPTAMPVNDDIQKKAEQLLADVGLLGRRDDFPLALGRADRVKAVFAAVLATGPRIIMLDEPFAGQDMRGCRLIMGILAGLHRSGYTVIMVTHNARIISEYARRIIVMEEGCVAEDLT